MAEGTAIRVGYHIGRGNVEAAKLVAQISFAVNAALGIVVALVGYYFRYELASSLSSDPAVVAISVQLSPLLWVTFAFFSVGDQALGVLEGQGRAVAQAVCFLLGAVGITIPLALASYFGTEYGLIGLWYALLVGFLCSELIAIALVLYYSRWDQAVADAITRIEADNANEAWDFFSQINKTASRDEERERDILK